MSVRSRLTLFFVAIVVVPLIGVSVLVYTSFDRSQVERTKAVLAADQRAALGALDVRGDQAAETARRLAGDPALQRALAGRDARGLHALTSDHAGDGLTVAVTQPDGRMLASSGPPPRFLPDVRVPPLDQLLHASTGDPRHALFVRRYAAVVARGNGCAPTCQLGRVWVGFWADGRELSRLHPAPDRRYTFVVSGRPVASSDMAPDLRSETEIDPGAAAAPPGGGAAAEQSVLRGDGFGQIRMEGDDQHALAAAWSRGLAADEAALVVSTPVDATASAVRRLGSLLAVLVTAVLVVVTLLGARLARMVSEPLGALADQARRIARGEFDRVPPHVGAGGEIGDLARAFDQMRTELDHSMRALRESRDQLTWAMTRVGDTLASTSDLPRLLGVVLEAAATARQARAGSLLLFTPDRAMLIPEATYRLDPDAAGPVPSGEGITGRVAATGEALVLPVTDDEPAYDAAGDAPTPSTVPAPTAAEPAADTQVTVPLRARGTVLGVLSLYDRIPGGPFTAEDAAALAAFAGQAAVGIENVRLHEEARHQSMTDDMTGTWNYRYFRLRFEQEIERAKRFRRAVSLLILDVDRFKEANDRYGHPRGDEILRELAQRVDAMIRDADTFARYGGEEFVLILPETDASGAVAAAEKLRGAVGARPFPGRAGVPPASVTVSIGVACFPRHAASSAALIEAADTALYRAKSAGRDRVCLAETPVGEVLPGAADPARGGHDRSGHDRSG